MHQLKIIIRKAQQEKLLTSLKLISLIIGFSVALIIFSWATQEFGKNQSVKDGEQIYRLAYTYTNSQGTQDEYVGNAPWSPALHQELPEVVDYTRYLRNVRAMLQHNQHKIDGTGLMADSTFHSFWGMEIIASNQNSPLKQPFSIVLTETLAKKLFGQENPIGQQLQVNNDFSVSVTAVVKDVPEDFTIPFDFLVFLVTMLGLFAFIYFNIQQRTKEIGIRKVNGARTIEILMLFWKNSVFFIIAAIALGIFASYPFITEWLQNYTYQVEMNIWTILGATAIVMVLSLTTITWQIILAANRNPVQALRYE